MKTKLIALVLLTCGAVQTADAAWNKLTNWWYSKEAPIQTPQKPIWPKDEKLPEPSTATDKGKKTTEAEWNNAQKEFANATNQMFDSVETQLKELTQGLAQIKIALLPENGNMSQVLPQFEKIDENTYKTFSVFLNESRGITKMVETRQIAPEDFTDFKSRTNAIKKYVNAVAKTLYEINSTGHKQGRTLFAKTLKDVLTTWNNYVQTVKEICKKNSVYFTQGDDEIQYILPKAKKLTDLGASAKKRILELVDTNNENLLGLAESIFNGIDVIIESFTNQWAFFKSAAELKNTIKAAYQTAAAGIKKQVSTIEHMDITNEDFENLSKSTLELM